jgi:hypothetical protein
MSEGWSAPRHPLSPPLLPAGPTGVRLSPLGRQGSSRHPQREPALASGQSTPAMSGFLPPWKIRRQTLGGSGKRQLADGGPSAIGKAFGLAAATRTFSFPWVGRRSMTGSAGMTESVANGRSLSHHRYSLTCGIAGSCDVQVCHPCGGRGPAGAGGICADVHGKGTEKRSPVKQSGHRRGRAIRDYLVR